LPSFVEALLVVLEESFLDPLAELEQEVLQDFLAQPQTELRDFQAKVEFGLDQIGRASCRERV
jgi:hypothetical protein